MSDMSREEAINILKQRQCCMECVADCKCEDCDKAFEMAMESLENQKEEQMNTNFIVILDPEIDEETGELIIVTSKLNKGDDESLEILGAFSGDQAKEILDLFLGMADKEDKENGIF